MRARGGLVGGIVLSLVLAAGQLNAQIREVDEDEARQGGPRRFQAGGHLTLAIPQGEFSNFVDVGGGLGAWAAVNLDRRGMFALKLDGSFIVYGQETRRRPLSPTVPFVTVDVTTSNNIMVLGFGPLITLSQGGIRPYLSGTIGFSYFVTESSVRGSNNSGSFAESTNFDDFTFAWTGGGGIRFRVSNRATPIFIDVGTEYHRNGQANYLREGSIQDDGQGGLIITPIRSETNLLLVKLGVSANF